MTGVRLSWIPRRAPLAVAAVAARGAVATAVAERLLDREDLAELRGVVGIAWLVVLGPEPQLPWIDGVTLLGVDPRAPGLLVPTTLDTDPPLALVARAMLRGDGGKPRAAPLAVLPEDFTLVSVASARTDDRRTLAAWVRARS